MTAMPGPWRKATRSPEDQVAHDRNVRTFAEAIGTDPASLSGLPLIEILSRHAARRPTDIAVVGPDQRLDWATLMSRVERLGRAIAARVPAGGAVAVLLAEGPEALVGVLACVAAARVALVMNAGHPVERNSTILQSGRAAAVLAREIHAGLVLPAGTIILSPDAHDDQQALPPPMSPDVPGFVIYTSGSTGQPKGIVWSHGICVDASLRFIIDDCAGIPGPPRLVASLFALSAAIGFFPTLSALIAGESVMVADKQDHLAVMIAEPPHLLVVLPAMLRALLMSRDAPKAFARLAILRAVAEVTVQADLDEWYRQLPAGCIIQNAYGQTEAIITQSDFPPTFREPGVLPLGRVMPEIDFAVLDESGQAVPDGEAGTLHVRGRYVSLGEWDAGRCVAGRVKTDPQEPDKRSLNTGDVVALRPDGMLAFSGRADRQVKVRGLRIEPAEIEAALRACAGITDAAVAARRQNEDTELLAFVVEATQGAAAAALAHVKAALPPQMHPRRIIALPALPRLPAGKIDQLALLQLPEVTAPPRTGAMRRSNAPG